MSSYCVVGGAGFIGSHVTDELLGTDDSKVVVFDNLCSGSKERLGGLLDDPRLQFIEGDLKERDDITTALRGCDHVYHFAANPDIAKAATQPDIDFWEGTYLTQNLLEGCRLNGVKQLTYASGSGVYGDLGDLPVSEAHGPLYPVSTYGASKLGCEALISSYCHMFELSARAFRFANVVGPRQTHGVTYDFARRLLQDRSQLEILGDGNQSKSYIHVSDVVAAMLQIAEEQWQGFEIFNVGTEDYVTVREIADMVVTQLGLSDVEYRFSGGSRGWKGDVPVVRFDSKKIRAHGWSNRYSSSDALADSIAAMIAEARNEVESAPD